MTTSSSTLWQSIRGILTQGDWTPLQKIYTDVAQRLQFDADDLKPEVGDAKQRAWQRNVRNVLGQQVKIGVVERATSGPARYRLTADRTAWTSSELNAIVPDYLTMLKDEIRGIDFSKTQHRRSLLPRLQDRSEQSIEFKHQNISAVLADEGLPYLEGYKPRGHYQGALRDAVVSHLDKDSELAALLVLMAQETPTEIPASTPSAAFVPRPTLRPNSSTESSSQHSKGRFVDYAGLEARNSILGRAGEEWVRNLEQARLIEAGYDDLAPKVEWVSQTQGDGLGYDVASFDTDRSPIAIEVKTTTAGPEMPFLVTARELAFSKTSGSFRLYRVFNFKTEPRVYVLAGDLTLHLDLVPRVLEAHIRPPT